MIQPLWRTVWRFFKKLKIELPYDPLIPLLGVYLEKTIIDIYAWTSQVAQTVKNLPAVQETWV